MSPPRRSITAMTISPEHMADIRASWAKIEAELPEQMARLSRMDEAAAESSLTGQLRQAVHQSGQQVPQIAAAAGIDPLTLCDWLEGPDVRGAKAQIGFKDWPRLRRKGVAVVRFLRPWLMTAAKALHHSSHSNAK